MKARKNILVTGGLGFIGSNYLNKYVRHYPNYNFVNIDCITYAADQDNILIDGCSNYFFERVDIRDYSQLDQLFEKYKISDVIHFAAESHVDMSISNPSIFIETNVQGTHNLLVLSKKNKIDRFHQISTDEVYGSLTSDGYPFTTKSPVAPNSPYSASKASADMIVRAYNKTYGLNTVITRCSNNYGPRQDATKLIPKFLSLLLSDKHVPLYSRGENIRDWIYVEDHIEAIDLVFHRGTPGEMYNVGGNCEMSNKDIVYKLLEATGKDESYIDYVADRPGHDFRYAIDINEIHSQLGWKPRFNFREGLSRTLDFYQSTQNHNSFVYKNIRVK